MVFAGLILCAMIWLLRDAFFASSASQGQLIYSEGQWLWQHAGGQTQGTLRLHLDLQIYLLASFAPTAVQTRTFFPRTTQWFHLEARQIDAAARAVRWLGVRRAVHASAEPSHEERAA